jgi:hypothetical protein
VLSDDSWLQQAKLLLPTNATARAFGRAVAISGDTVVVGAPSTDAAIPGTAYVSVRTETTWSEPVELVGGPDLVSHEFGGSVAIAGDIAVVGDHWASIGDVASGAGYEGAAYVYRDFGMVWQRIQRLSASDGATANHFGFSVAISGANVLVGAPHTPAGQTGAAYLYSTTDWSERRLPNPPDHDFYHEFGHSVALEETIAVVGAPYHQGAGPVTGIRRGAAYVYTLTDSETTARRRLLLPEDRQDQDIFGTSVAVSGNIVMIGAPGADSVFLFDRSTPGGPVDRLGDRNRDVLFGGSIEVDADVAVIGSAYGQNGAYVAEFLGVDGSPCISNGDCRARHCVAGVCCDQACSGACETCASGTCTAQPLSAGTPSCWPYLCNESAGGCPEECAAHRDCVDTHYCQQQLCSPRLASGDNCSEARDCVSGRCSDGKCAGTLAIGEPCETPSDCDSGFCVDGVCCDQGCDGQCEACDVPDALGICSVVSGAPHGDRPACDGEETRCGGECDGAHSASCVYPTSRTSCGSSCSEGMRIDSNCDGRGNCEAGEPRSCGNFRCADESTCRTSCQEIGDCLSGFTCQSGVCEAGATCIDTHTAQGPDGLPEPCEPYLCAEGSCKTRCDQPDDCSDDSVCDHDHRCVLRPARPADAASTSGCGCRFAGSPYSRSRDLEAVGSGAVILGLLVFSRRRRLLRARCGGGRAHY